MEQVSSAVIHLRHQVDTCLRVFSDINNTVFTVFLVAYSTLITSEIGKMSLNNDPINDHN
jgi:hypothetical protein